MARKSRISAALLGLMTSGEHHAWTLEVLHTGLAENEQAAADFSRSLRRGKTGDRRGDCKSAARRRTCDPPEPAASLISRSPDVLGLRRGAGAALRARARRVRHARSRDRRRDQRTSYRLQRPLRGLPLRRHVRRRTAMRYSCASPGLTGPRTRLIPDRGNSAVQPQNKVIYAEAPSPRAGAPWPCALPLPAYPSRGSVC